MWERTLQDLVRGLRANKKDETKFIGQAVDEIRQEIKSKDMELKAGAVLKLTYLDMLGYDMSWASFHVIEVMSSPRIHLKTIGYLAAVQSFEQETDVLMLTTNLLKKDLASTPTEIAVTLNGVSHIVTPDLARDVAPELIAMLNHSRPHVRKRAVLALFKVFKKYPEARPYGMPRVREKLEDPDPSVITATINLLCEMARENPQDYLPLAPQLFHLLTTSSNNWMLIKIIKLFGSLSPYEPRLVKKLQPPITELISTTPAISLLYECVHTCIIGGMLEGLSGSNLARTCVSKLAGFLQDPDQNLKYIALLAMAKIVPSHPHLVAEYQDMILSSVDDQDISIRMRALDLISAMVNEQNLQSIVQQILSHLVGPDTPAALPSATQSLLQSASPLIAPAAATTPAAAPSQAPAYRLVLAQRVLQMCAHDTYARVADFEWHLSVLVDLAYVARVGVGAQIRDQLVEVAGRVRGARRFAVQLMVKVLNDDTFVLAANEKDGCVEILWAAAWICGEYCRELSDPQKLLSPLLQPGISRLPSDIAAVYIHAAMKVTAFWMAELAERWSDSELPEVQQVVETVLANLEGLAASPHIEVQERAANAMQLFRLIQADLSSHRPWSADSPFSAPDAPGPSTADAPAAPRFPKSLLLLSPLFAGYELNAVAEGAQRSVPVPPGLALDAWFVPPPREEEEDGADGADGEAGADGAARRGRKGKARAKEVNGARKAGKGKGKSEKNGRVHAPGASGVDEAAEEEQARRERRKRERLEMLRDDPYYIVDDRPKKSAVADVDSIPIVRLDDLPSLASPTTSESSRLPSLRERPATQPLSSSFVVDRTGEMPQRAPAPPVPHSAPVSRGHTPISFARAAPALPAFPQYEVPGEPLPQASAPQLIKVKKVKKAGAAGKKKRTSQLEPQPSDQ